MCVCFLRVCARARARVPEEPQDPEGAGDSKNGHARHVLEEQARDGDCRYYKCCYCYYYA